MKLKSLKIKGFKNLTGADGWFTLDFTNKDGITVLIGNNGSGKSNVLEAISAIFIGLYKIGTPQRKPIFNYEIEYSIGEDIITDIKIKLINGTYGFYTHGTKTSKKDFINLIDTYLPSRVIASYSGEETRLWDTYYKHSYSDFINSIKNNDLRGLPEQKLFYINSNYWNEALIVFLLSELEGNENFVSNNLAITSIENISFKFNTNNIAKFETNMITEFTRQLNPENKDSINMSFEVLKNLITGYEYDLFIKLIASTQSELITNITINFNQKLTTEDLSEGQKKQILIRAILEFLVDLETLILLDEPDSHIHVANKIDFKNMLTEYEYRNMIMTSHSPTLMNIFENNLEYLEDGKKLGKEKAEILREISGDLMSMSEQQIVLNSSNDILLVEGKTDEMHIKIALERLQEDHVKYKELKFEYVPLGGADGLNLFIDKFVPKKNQRIIALLDRDETGKGIIKNILADQNIDFKTFKYKKKNAIFISCYPIKENFIRTDFVVEDYYDINLFTNFLMKDVVDFKSIPRKDKRKTDFAEYCKTHTDKLIFKDFESLFDLLLKIKE